MAKQVWYPENGDEVRFTDGRVGKVTDDGQDPRSTGEGSWEVDVEFESDPENEDFTPDNEEVEPNYDETEKVWKEVEA